MINQIISSQTDDWKEINFWFKNDITYQIALPYIKKKYYNSFLHFWHVLITVECSPQTFFWQISHTCRCFLSALLSHMWQRRLTVEVCFLSTFLFLLVDTEDNSILRVSVDNFALEFNLSVSLLYIWGCTKPSAVALKNIRLLYLVFA